MKSSALRFAWTVAALAVILPAPCHGGSKLYDFRGLLNQKHPLDAGPADRPPPVLPPPPVFAPAPPPFPPAPPVSAPAAPPAFPPAPPVQAPAPRVHTPAPPVYSPPSPPARERKKPKPYALAVYGGWLTDNAFEDVFVPWELDFRKSGILGVAASYRLGGFGDYLEFEAEGQIVRHIGAQDHWEFNLPFMTRWKLFPWDHFLDTDFAFGIGPSYATEVPSEEVAMDGESQKLLVYWVAELSLASPGSDWETLLRLHHRSGAFGLVADDGGSNILALGLRRRF